MNYSGLKNKTILVTRDQKQSKELAKQIENLGGRCVEYPTVKIVETVDWSDCDDALRNLNSFDWIIFSSINGVRSFLRRAKANNVIRYEGKIATVGLKTKKEVQEFGWYVDLIPEKYSAEGLLNVFESVDLRNKSVLLPTSDLSRDELPDGLKQMGAAVKKVITYRTECNQKKMPVDVADKFRQKKIDAILFFSPSAVNCFFEKVDDTIILHINRNKVAIGAVGHTTAKAVKKAGLTVHIIPEKSTQENLIKEVAAYFNEKMEKLNAG